MTAPADFADEWTTLLAEGRLLLAQGKSRDARDVARAAYHAAMQAFARSTDADEKGRLRVLMNEANALALAAR
jgi:hypothetical protein